ncbi:MULTISPECIES: SixA phosphatase family protein [Massilia]|uniref:SixA phosphatase family protein n=1 Tax=Massilia haematophila TaxID=457923 RepID=A0ABV7PH30_9BURK|nr:histidine phosphatase family protein [Massilia sp.]HBZ05151.1 histidine phosphatase family protein [Massilia sp.]
MELILWRHAEAEAGEPDAQRALSAKGIRHAARMGAWLDRQLPEGCRIFVSPTVRCIQTADALGRRYTIHEALGPDSTVEAMLDACGWPHHRFPALLVGHQPRLGETASTILAGAAQPWKIRKGNVLWIRGAEPEPGGDPAFIKLAVGPELVGKLR